MLIKQKLEKSHEKMMVRHRKVPNLAKNCKLQANSGKDACGISQTHTASQCLSAARLPLRIATREGWCVLRHRTCLCTHIAPARREGAEKKQNKKPWWG